MKRRLFAVACLLGAAGFASADCHVRNRVVKLDTITATEFLPLAVTVPAYSVGRGQDDDLRAEVARLSALVEALMRRMDGAAAKPAAVPKADHPGLEVLAKNCASCHSAPGKGGLTLFKGGAIADEIDAVQLGLIAARVRAGEMPPKSKLSPAQRDEIQRWVDEQFRGAKEK